MAAARPVRSADPQACANTAIPSLAGDPGPRGPGINMEGYYLSYARDPLIGSRARGLPQRSRCSEDCGRRQYCHSPAGWWMLMLPSQRRHRACSACNCDHYYTAGRAVLRQHDTRLIHETCATDHSHRAMARWLPCPPSARSGAQCATISRPGLKLVFVSAAAAGYFGATFSARWRKYGQRFVSRTGRRRRNIGSASRDGRAGRLHLLYCQRYARYQSRSVQSTASTVSRFRAVAR